MFNALKYIEELEKVGLTREQAEAWTKCQIEIMEQNLATKQSVRDSEFALRQDYVALRQEMKEMGTSLRQEMKEMEMRLEHKVDQIDKKFEYKLDQLESRMTIKLGSMMAASMALTVTLIVTLLKI